MKRLLLLPLMLLLATCSMEQKHSGTVNFQITIDQVVMSKYFGAKCEKDLPLAPPEEIELCTEESIGAFLDAISQIAGTKP